MKKRFTIQPTCIFTKVIVWFSVFPSNLSTVEPRSYIRNLVNLKEDYFSYPKVLSNKIQEVFFMEGLEHTTYATVHHLVSPHVSEILICIFE